jgi:hypothetical protein
MNRGIIVALLIALITIVNGGIFAATQLDMSSERRAAMQLSDSLDTRLYQMVNARATVQASAGRGATASVNGNDAVGQVNITTGTATAAGSLVHVTFTQPYLVQPFVIVAPMDQPPPAGWYTTVDTNGFDIWVGVAPKPGTNYPFSYLVAPRPWLMYLNEPRG